MNQRIAMFTIVVRDYDEAIHFYCKKLGFNLTEDTVMSETKRWVVVCPPGNGGCHLLLAKAVGELQAKSIGNQTGNRVFIFLHTDDFERDFNRLEKHGIEIVRQPSLEPYGKVAVFKDLYGNLWDLVQPISTSSL